jgi:hypothetical protein
VTSIVSASDEAAQSKLMMGTLNIAACPACGAQSRVAGPLLYFNLASETALVLVPDTMALSHKDQEKTIGRLTNRLVESLPAEDRRMYLLQPRMFFTESTFVDALLESVGVRPDDIRHAQESAILIDELLALTGSDDIAARLASVGQEEDTALVTLTAALAEEASGRGDTARAEALLALRDQLLEIIGPPTISLEDFVQELLAARDSGDLRSVVAALRPVLSYEFFTALTERIEAAVDPVERSDLSSLRKDLLAAIDALDAEAEADVGRAARRLEAVLLAPNPATLLEEQSDSVDETFLMVTEANLRAATEQGRFDQAAKLQQILDAALAVVEAKLPPQMRLVNRLVRCQDAAQRAEVLDESPDLIDAGLESVLRLAASRARTSGAEPAADALDSAADDVDIRLVTAKVTSA